MKLKKIIRWLVILLILGGVIGAYITFFRQKKVEYVTETAKITDVREVVDVTGSVEANTAVSLRFQSSGRIAQIFVKTGDKVKMGQIIGSLDNEIQNIEVKKAEAALAMAQADVDLMHAGPAQEERIISLTDVDEAKLTLAHSAENLVDVNRANTSKIEKVQQEVKNAESALRNAEITLENSKKSGGTSQEKAGKTLADIFIDAENDIRSALDAIEHALSAADQIIQNNDETGKARQIYLGFRNPQSLITVKKDVRGGKSRLNDLLAAFEAASQEWNASTISAQLAAVETGLTETKTLMDNLFDLLEASKISASLTTDDIDGFKADVTAEKTALLARIDIIRTTKQGIDDAELDISSTDISSGSNVDVAQAAVEDAQNRLELANKSLAEINTQNQIAMRDAARDIELKKLALRRSGESLKKLVAKPRPVDLASAQAKVSQMWASLRQAQKAYDDMFLKAPVDGIVTVVNREVGENISATEEFAVLISDNLQIKANISETDIAKISLADPVTITFDALPLDAVFHGTVASIDPAETVVQGVIYYQAAIAFDAAEGMIRSGMTANLEILADERSNVLTVTPEAIQFEENKPFLYILEDGIKIRRDIETGLEGDTTVEITKGITDGDRIILYETEN